MWAIGRMWNYMTEGAKIKVGGFTPPETPTSYVCVSPTFIQW